MEIKTWGTDMRDEENIMSKALKNNMHPAKVHISAATKSKYRLGIRGLKNSNIIL